MTPPDGSSILITGATGNVGSEVLKQLMARGISPKVALRDPKRSPDPFGVEFDFQKPETFGPALAGIKSIFLVRPPQLADARRDFGPFLNKARELGIEHIVFLSLLGADKNTFMPHAKIEKLILEAGVPYTFLRAGFFMQNLSTTHAREIRDLNEVLVPAGNGRTAFIDVADIGEVAVKALLEPEHRSKAFDLTGSEALSYDDVAKILTTVLGREILYKKPSIARFAYTMRKREFPWGMILVMTAIYTVARVGLAGTISPELERFLKRPPRRFSEFARVHRNSWL